MKKLLRGLIPQSFINSFYHLPKAFLACVYYGFPTRKLRVIGITGTDGKTTTTNMVYQILKGAGKKVSMVSTINAVIGGTSYDTGLHITAPDPFTVQKFAKRAVENGDEYLVLEVTSHGIDQYRFFGIKFEIGVITNITHEHLDYHKTFENYANTKMKLLKNTKFAVVNQDIKGDWGNMGNRVIKFGLNKGDFNQRDLKLSLKIPGDYNIENALAALAVVSTLGIDQKSAIKSVESFDNLSGRMEEVKNNLGIKVIVDFAHTPNGLENALKTLKAGTKGKLIAVFGSASKRDLSKRPLMGAVAGKVADYTILTAEDPRGESVEKICSQIALGLKKAGKILDKDYWIVPDRKEAIEFAIQKLAKKGDVVGIFGKGHEQSMNLDGKKEISWSDVGVVQGLLNDSSQPKKSLAR